MLYLFAATLLVVSHCQNHTLHTLHRSKREIPDTFTKWFDEGATNTPEDQMGCGGCWGFPTTGMLEAQYKIHTGELPSLSEQYLIDCTFDYSGCAGGAPDDGLKRMRMRQFFPSDTTYSYKGYYSDKCPAEQSDGGYLESENAYSKLWVTSYHRVPAIESSVMEELQNGPLAIGMYISNSIYNGAGSDVYEDVNCASDHLAHSMLLIGYTPDYWHIKASYGTSFGDNGYLKLKRGSTAVQCEILKNVWAVNVTPRKDLEYVLGSGMLNFSGANKYCKALDSGTKTGWTLAVIPTEWHNQQVWKLFTDKYGSSADSDDKYNYLWIGLSDGDRDGAYTWADKVTPLQYTNFTNSFESLKFGRMKKPAGTQAGSWFSTGSTSVTHRFVCSRARQCWDISTIVDHATVSFSDSYRSEGSTATVSCGSGYVLNGAATVTCGTSGVWGTLPTCDASATSGCAVPNIPHANLTPTATGATYADGTSVTVSCATGYKVSSNTVMTCNTDTFGALADMPSCSLAQCDKPTIADATLSPDQSKYNHNTEVTVSCGTGFTISGNNKILCSEEVFSTLPTCTQDSSKDTDAAEDSSGKCNGGYFRDSGTNTCTKCSAGTWLAKAADDQASCAACPTGKTSLEGADLETECFWPNCKCGMLKREDGIYYYSCNCY